ncbi:superoxide dismutase family protein [Caulobacter sp. 17J65-9]|uniref:superoxide dismutase family protein n=1 Tax=Caulobacter sp. 17J65-9 TaxID=2709382 RepID=UPI0013C6BE53|nr:superoxide dismutase family protein [Caulobacter sp. 17J65-9]NEX95238.1 superoxide dismutase family protein [Caulobacter sp. 17J65-9]
MAAAPAPAPAAKPAAAEPAPKPAATAELKDASGATVGTATIFEGPGGLLMRIEAGGIPSGWHGVHFHEKGVCTPPDFASAGAHIKAGDHLHGLLNPKGHEAGDLPNLWADGGGRVEMAVWSNSVSVKGAEGRPALLDADGSAVVIHANPDDQHNQPTGNSGGRIVCGVVKAAG